MIDGAKGEGGGQILRTALALSLCLGRPFRIINIRCRRENPGLRPQHLAAVRAAAEVGGARVEGASVDSQTLGFVPGGWVKGGEYRFDIGTAGSTGLVLQTVLPALLRAEQPSQLTLSGGTHNPLAPSFEFLQQAFVPLINRMGPSVTMALERPGFYPAGGGVVHAAVEPVDCLKPLYLLERGSLMAIRAEVLLSQLPEHIARRELRVLSAALGIGEARQAVNCLNANGPGNAVTVSVVSEHITEVFVGFGARGVRAETVAHRLVADVQCYLQAGVPVGEYLADQLLLPLALAGAGAIQTVQPSLHTQTNLEVLRQFLHLHVKVEEQAENRWLLALRVG